MKPTNGWFLKLAAAALLSGSIAWGATITKTSLTTEVRVEKLERQYERIEAKIDQLLFYEERQRNALTPTR